MNILIINDTNTHINYDSLEKGCGGSETWALQLGQAFVNRGNFTIICTTTNEKDILEVNYNTLNIINIKYLENLLNQFQFDFVIISRIISNNVLYLLKNYNVKYSFYQFHDLYPIEKNYKDTMQFVNKNVVLTSYHAKYIHKLTDIDYSKFAIIPNGIDINLFENIDIENKNRDNRILWCSNPDRGLYLILKYLYDDIKKEIPDFGIDIAYPNYSKLINTKILSNKDIRNIGSLSKTELYKEMIKHKCWCYPQNFIDTFCISMLENAICNVNIICPWWYAPGDIFGEFNKDSNYKKIIESKDEFGYHFYTDYINSPEFEKYIKWLKDQIINAIKNYNDEKYRIKRQLMQRKVIQNYIWDRVAQMYENLYLNEKCQHGDI